MLDTPPKTSIFGHLLVKADQLFCAEGYGRAIDLSEGQGHIPYMESHVLLKVKVGHLTTLSPFLLLFHFDPGTCRSHTKSVLDALANIFLQN